MYNSSIINNYGDPERVKSDVETLNDILNRQGQGLLIDAIAEYIGNVANKFKLSASDRAMSMIAAVDSLENAIKERI